MISTMAVTALGGLGALIATVVAAVNSCGGDGVRGGKVLIIGHVGAALAFLVVFFFFLVDSDLIDWLIDGLLRQGGAVPPFLCLICTLIALRVVFLYACA
jgi:hypothetical protein